MRGAAPAREAPVRPQHPPGGGAPASAASAPPLPAGLERIVAASPVERHDDSVDLSRSAPVAGLARTVAEYTGDGVRGGRPSV
ncbi:hypothetical protein SUDANB176_00979 [Streptomyces sp. enrichment culture]|uniref:hypothetical protein n=1 Tax=Streptomyces sp. enrichment culture TaxID=1795815 RepID=UPI003F54CCA7